jgi:enamine deaminase RidA (YjgF/YER057c/UK114 family)
LTASGDLSHHLRDEEAEERKEVERVCEGGGRVELSGGSPWEPIAVCQYSIHVRCTDPAVRSQGYCRAVRVGDRIQVSGTTTTQLPDGRPIGGTSLSSQTVHILDTVSRAIRKLGGTMKDVVRTRIMLEGQPSDGAWVGIR